MISERRKSVGLLQNIIRMSSTDFEHLITLVRPKVSKTDTIVRQVISVLQEWVCGGVTKYDKMFIII